MAEGEQSSTRSTSAASAPTRTEVPAPQPFELDDLLLLDSAGNDPLGIDAIIFDDNGIAVVRHRDEQPRLLPWASVSAHVVERWSGGIIPEWWVDPELNRSDPPPGQRSVVTDPQATSRSMPHIEPGALIGIQTPTRTYRFVLPGGDPHELSRRITAFAVRRQGPSGASSVTTVVGKGSGSQSERDTPPGDPASSWSKIQPYLVVLLILLICTAVTLILLQSAGAIHLPFLGGANSGSPGPLRTP